MSRNRKFVWRGKRIRKKDDRLVLRSVILFTILMMITVSWTVYGDKLAGGSWETLTKYEICSGAVGGVILSAVLLYLYYKKTRFKKLIKRQRLAKMVLGCGWYETETIRYRNGHKRITYFPAIYYREKERNIYITVKIDMGKYQEKLLCLEDKLETGFACELVEKDMRGIYLRYTFLQEVEKNRISVAEVRAEHGSLLLMRHICWKYDSMPHMLIAGMTGGGKTYFLMTIIEALLYTDAQLYIVDPKNMDLAYLGRVLPEVHYEKDAILECIRQFYERMTERTNEMKAMSEYLMGMNYADLGFSPQFLVFDEYVAFMEMLGKKEWEEPMALVRKIVMLGRQAGFFLILACQRPDAKYLGDGIRDQFGFRAALGEMSESGYSMMFGSSDKHFIKKKFPGRGYINEDGGVITEFYTPFVPEGHDFFNEIKRLYEQKHGQGIILEEKSEPNVRQEEQAGAEE